MHAFDTENGNELWAFSPKELLANHNIFFEDTNAQSHPYGLDGPMSVWRNDEDNNLIVDDVDDKALLIIPMRRGGSNYYALDVTNPNEPKLAWVIEGGENGTPGFDQLGQSWSKAVPARIKVDDDMVDVLVFGAGYDVAQDPNYDDLDDRTQPEDTVGLGLYIVEALTGDLIWSAKGINAISDTATFTSSRTELFTQMKYSMPASPNVIDIDSDGIADQIYTADMGGQVWRFDIINSGDDLITGGVIADLNGTLSSEHRRFYNTLDVSLVSSDGDEFIAISVGSGWRARPLDKLIEDRFYVLKSSVVRGAPAGYGKLVDNTWNPVTENDLVNITGEASPQMNGFGWFVELPDEGEKVLSRAVTFDNTVFFSTYTPDSNPGNCQVSVGGGYAYAINIASGRAMFDFDGDGTVDGDLNSQGSVSDIRVQLNSSGLTPTPTVFISDGGADPILLFGTEKIDTNLTNATRRTNWAHIEDVD